MIPFIKQEAVKVQERIWNINKTYINPFAGGFEKSFQYFMLFSDKTQGFFFISLINALQS